MMKVILLISCYVAISMASDPKLFEGDIVLSPNAKKVMKGEPFGYDGITSTRMHWKNGVIPYRFSSSFDSNRIAAVKRAMSEYHSKTCIRFKQRTVERDYVNFMVGGGCYSHIGRTGGKQDVSIGNGCTSQGTIIHELMHAVGFFHEQSRLDRDQHITIYWKNIQGGMDYNFKKYSHGEADYFGAGYDLDSVMHYGRTAFGGGRVTIAAKSDYNRQLGQRRGFTQTDINQINTMYQCGGVTTKPIVTSRPTVQPSKCVDKHGSCKYWEGVGECTKSADYMKVYCRKSCKHCTVSTCKDYDSNCTEYKTRGYCTGSKFYPWMMTNCKRTCNKC